MGAFGKGRIFRKSKEKASSGNRPAFSGKRVCIIRRFLNWTTLICQDFGRVKNIMQTFCQSCGSSLYSRSRRLGKLPGAIGILMERMGKEISVSLHIRRGDYLDLENAAMFGGICTDAYYEAAVRFIRDRFPEAHFYVFSDDPAYAKERYRSLHFTGQWTGIPERAVCSIYAAYTSCCNHNICANSTFSFWGARLNPSKDKIMIRPAKHKNGQDVGMERMQELWEGWKLIDGEGKMK